jgi:hypothetical protein
MIASAKPVRRPGAAAWNAFLTMLPAIARHARIAFRSRRGDERDDLIQEVVANAAVAFLRLFQLGKSDLAYPSVLARYGVAQVLEGRRVGNRLRIGDVLSSYCQRKKGIVVERLDKLDPEEGQWQEIVIEDRNAGPADIARVRIDFDDWLKQLPRRSRHVAQFLSLGNRTSEAARKFGTSEGRISQLRRELAENWQRFVGEPPVAETVPT